MKSSRRFGGGAAVAALLCATLIVSGCSADTFSLSSLDPSAVASFGAQNRPSIDSDYDPDIDADALNAQIEMGLESIELQRYVAPNVPIQFQKVGFDQISGWEADDHGAALRAFRRSCKKLRRLRKTTILGGLASHIEDWRPSCDAADEVSPRAARAFFEFAFAPIRIAPDKQAKITSYYEPRIEARRRPDRRFRYPIYAQPKELLYRNGRYGYVSRGSFKPYHSRAEIYAGRLKGRGLEIAYLNDPVDLFYLQIQGSGLLSFADGSTARVGFAAKNGHPYKSAAGAMIRKGILPRSKASQANIKKFVAKNPRLGMRMLAENPSYIFFRELNHLDPKAGPVGALGIQLTAGRSIAIDRRFNPLGAPVWLDTPGPQGRIRKLVVAQDTGSAIRGAQRADYFWGTGARAGEMSGKVNYKGELTVLLPTATVRRLTDRPVQ